MNHHLYASLCSALAISPVRVLHARPVCANEDQAPPSQATARVDHFDPVKYVSFSFFSTPPSNPKQRNKKTV